ncbi:MAG: hypothetical protein IPN91_03530 [Holophagaceae bacterium]|uniref:Lipoprotein n=1 Tax=Candidatus Geothrix odensensis TaxID=2954440 RepID=A0A936K5C3_9BACT|nr:hypothetical protein [Candidatus Geothrix odensensis]
MRILLPIIVLIFISCTTPESRVASSVVHDQKDTESVPKEDQIKEALETQVKDMEFLGEVHGFSGWYGVFAAKGYANAKEDALEQAKGLGGTHVVFDKQVPHYGGTEVHGRAYREGPKAPKK